MQNKFTLNEILNAVDKLSEKDAKEVALRANKRHWKLFTDRITATHYTARHAQRHVLVEGCYECFPLGTRIGG